MIHVGELRVMTAEHSHVKEGTEFIVRNLITHTSSQDKYVGCEFFIPVRFGHDLSIQSTSYNGYHNERCPEDHGTYFSLNAVKKYSKPIMSKEPDWEV